MKKFLKLYWPMAISLLLLIIYGILFGAMFSSDALFYNDILGVGIVILTALLVIAVYGEMIYFFINAANNKKLKNKVLWCIGLYFLNIFVMPYYHLKYVCEEKNIKTKIFIFAGYAILAFIIGVLVPISLGSSSYDESLYITADSVKFKFPAGYHRTNIGEYDIYAKDRRRNINFGGFIYTGDDEESAHEIMIIRDYWLKTTRKNVTVLNRYNESLSDREITTNIYAATHEGVKNIYYISVVEFKNSDVFVNTIGVYLYEDLLEHKDEFRQILVDMEYIGTN